MRYTNHQIPLLLLEMEDKKSRLSWKTLDSTQKSFRRWERTADRRIPLPPLQVKEQIRDSFPKPDSILKTARKRMKCITITFSTSQLTLFLEILNRHAYKMTGR